MGGQGKASHHGGHTQRLLDKWVDAKRTKKFDIADSIRAELRAEGIDPEKERPRDGSSSVDNVELELDRWVEAKRSRDFGTADAIRARLRAMGVDPDTARPGPPPAKRAREV